MNKSYEELLKEVERLRAELDRIPTNCGVCGCMVRVVRKGDTNQLRLPFRIER